MKKTIIIIIIVLTVCTLMACSNSGSSKPKEDTAVQITPAEALQGYWESEVYGITVSYKFQGGSYYTKLSAVVEGKDIDTGFSYAGTYVINESENKITLTLQEDNSTSNMRYTFKDGEITYLATIKPADGSVGAVLRKVSSLTE